MRYVTLILMLLSMFFNTGCLSPVAMGTVETTDSGAPLVIDHIGQRQGEGFCVAKYDEVVTATLQAAETLSLELKDKKSEANQTFFRFTDESKDSIDIYIKRRSDTMTSVKYDVGWFGSTALGRLVYWQIISGLPK